MVKGVSSFACVVVLALLAARQGETLSALVAAVDAERTPDRPLASVLRVFALRGGAAGRS